MKICFAVEMPVWRLSFTTLNGIRASARSGSTISPGLSNCCSRNERTLPELMEKTMATEFCQRCAPVF